MHFPGLHHDRRPIITGIALALASTLILSACTTYRPLDRGARVPWAQALASAEKGPMDGNRYRVGEGDVLSGIASRYDVRLTTLAAANNIEPPYFLYPGEVLRIPEDTPIPARRPQIARAAPRPDIARAEPRPEIIQTKLPPAGPVASKPPAPLSSQPAKPLSSPPAEPVWKRRAAPEPEGERYTVTSGDSLGLIAVQRGLTLGDLVAVNDLEAPYRIKPGQVLIIPPGEKTAGRGEGAETATSMAPPPPLSAAGFLWPVEGEMIGSFDQNNSNGRSGGVNIAARKGTPVRASDNGIVAYAGEALSGYGQMVMLRHADGYMTLYAHNDAILVDEGDVVQRGQPIAEVGDSGDVEKSQLHFELRKGTAPIDPTKVLAGLPGRRIGQL